MKRVYLDWNATTSLRPEARAAMISAMDVIGNPSSVHAEGRDAMAIIEHARLQIKQAFGASSSDIIFTSSATESAGLALANRNILSANIEHDCVLSWTNPTLKTNSDGIVEVLNPEVSAVQAANNETGILQDLPPNLALCDYVQAFGKISCAFEWSKSQMGLLSGHKIGGPKGIGALVLKQGLDVDAQIRGGGQEMGRRSGTQNVIGIAGFGAAAHAAIRDLENGVWQEVAELRDLLEETLLDAVPDINIFGKNCKRLPNTSYFSVYGWKGELQVMQMDLAGFAVSAGSACSSGKVKSSKVLKAMGYDDIIASSALRVSLGPENTKEDVLNFASAWIKAYKKFTSKAA